MHYRPVFHFSGGEVGRNGEVYATEHEAYMSASERFLRWTMPLSFGTEPTDDPVTFVWTEGQGAQML